MPVEARALCACGTEICPGALFCWQHSANAPRVGEFRADAGQLLWRTTSRAKGMIERAVAVLVDGRQIEVHEVIELLSHRPARVSVKYIERPVVRDAQPAYAEVELAALIGQFADGIELIDAKRSVS